MRQEPRSATPTFAKEQIHFIWEVRTRRKILPTLGAQGAQDILEGVERSLLHSWSEPGSLLFLARVEGRPSLLGKEGKALPSPLSALPLSLEKIPH